MPLTRSLVHERLAREAPPAPAVPRELQAEVERDVASQSQDVAERREVFESVLRLAVNARSRYHEQGEALGERIRVRAL